MYAAARKCVFYKLGNNKEYTKMGLIEECTATLLATRWHSRQILVTQSERVANHF